MSPGIRPVSLRDGIKRHIFAAKAARLSPRTVESKEETLGRFVSYAEDHEWPDFHEIKQHHIEEYIAWFGDRIRWDGLRGRANPKVVSSSHVETTYRRLHAFWEWAFKDGLIAFQPMARMKRPTFTQRIVKDISPEQIQNLRAITDYKNPKVAPTELMRFRVLRNRAALELSIDSCTRLSEITGIEVGDVRISNVIDIRVLGKGDKERWVPLNLDPGLTLLEYMNAREKYVQPGVNALWVSTQDRKGLPLDKSWLQRVVNKLGEAIGMERLHHHMFRHRFALDWIRSGQNERLLMALGGWSHKIPETYLRQIDIEDAASIHRGGIGNIRKHIPYKPSRI